MTDVLITAPAEYDLVNVEYATFVDLQNPQAAERIVDGNELPRGKPSSTCRRYEPLRGSPRSTHLPRACASAQVARAGYPACCSFLYI